MKYVALLEELKDAINGSASFDDATQMICERLYTLDEYDWVGFYMAAGNRMLHLENYVGDATDHTEIPYGKGICGQVAVSNESLVIDDVNAEDNYIACSITVKSEIVVPLFVRGHNIGQIDIDSHKLAAFNDEDNQFLIAINEALSNAFETYLVERYVGLNG